MKSQSQGSFLPILGCAGMGIAFAAVSRGDMPDPNHRWPVGVVTILCMLWSFQQKRGGLGIGAAFLGWLVACYIIFY